MQKIIYHDVGEINPYGPPKGSGADFTKPWPGNEESVRGPDLSITSRWEGGFTFWPIGADPVVIPFIPTTREEWERINAICVEKSGQGIPEMHFPSMSGSEQISFDPSRSLNDAFDK